MKYELTTISKGTIKTVDSFIKNFNAIGANMKALSVSAYKFLTDENKDVKIEYLADLCHLSPSRFFTVFKEEMGMTPTDYKNFQRASAAVALIISTSLTLEQICERLNVCSPAYLRRILQKYAGTTPKKIKENIGRL